MSEKEHIQLFNIDSSSESDVSYEYEEYEDEKREVTYTAYGWNIENTIKLLSSSKRVNLIDEKVDCRPKRMFITSESTLALNRQNFGSA